MTAATMPARARGRAGTTHRGSPEDDLLKAVIDLCKLLGLRTVHFRPAKTAQGWRTAVQGDGKGWPDLVIVGPGGVLYRELKATGKYPDLDQRAWIAALGAAGQDVAVWRPVDLISGRIEAELRAIRKGSSCVQR